MGKEDAPVIDRRAGVAGDMRRRLHILFLSEKQIYRQKKKFNLVSSIILHADSIIYNFKLS